MSFKVGDKVICYVNSNHSDPQIGIVVNTNDSGVYSGVSQPIVVNFGTITRYYTVDGYLFHEARGNCDIRLLTPLDKLL